MKIPFTREATRQLLCIGLLLASTKALAAPGCTWLQDTRNQVLPETHALYYRAAPPETLPAGAYIRIKGSFVNARYESFQLYDGLTLANDGSLSDYRIAADGGSLNPATSRSERTTPLASGGRYFYRVNIRFEAPPPVPAANTLYTTRSPSSELITLRRYESSTTEPLPTIEVVNADGSSQPLGTPQNNLSCALTQSQIALTTLSSATNLPATATAGTATPDQPFAVYYGSGIAQNQDARYLSVVLPRTKYYVLVRGRAPTSPARPGPSPQNFRYWSFCSYNNLLETVVGCAADDEIRIDAGFYNLVLTAGATPLAARTDQLFSVLPMGIETKDWVIMRQILDDPSFVASANQFPQGSSLSGMADYLPIARTCAPAIFNTAVAAGSTALEVWNACAATR